MARKRPLAVRIEEAASKLWRSVDYRASRRTARSLRASGEALLRNAIAGRGWSLIADALEGEGVARDLAETVGCSCVAIFHSASDTRRIYDAIKHLSVEAPKAADQARAARPKPAADTPKRTKRRRSQSEQLRFPYRDD